MSPIKASRTVTVTNRAGVHARAATMISEVARRFQAKVEVIKGAERVDAVDVLQVLSLGIDPGEQLLLEAAGDDAEKVLDELADLFNSRFGDEEPTENPET